MKAILNSDLLSAVSIAASTEETRYYLCGVHVEPHPKQGVIMTATDGHILATAHDLEGTIDKPRIILANFKSASFKTKAKEDQRRLHVNFKDEMGAIRDDDSAKNLDAVVVENIYATFPDWRNITPGFTRSEPTAGFGQFNPNLLAKTMSVFTRASGPDKPGPVVFQQKTPNDPALFVLDNPEINIAVIAMPMKSDELDVLQRYDWGKPQETAAA
jgi:hypothetical protein